MCIHIDFTTHFLQLPHAPSLLIRPCSCYARLPPRAKNCRKKQCGHSSQVIVMMMMEYYDGDDNDDNGDNGDDKNNNAVWC